MGKGKTMGAMGKRNAQASVLALAVLLAGCGGGSGVESTPTPSPTPTPTPTANDDLIAPLVSESFANKASTAAINVSGDGEITQASQSSQALTVSYNAQQNSYTVQAADRSQTFRPADKDAAGNYRRTSGAVVDDLTLTTDRANFAYRYVGAGFWQRQKRTSGGGVEGTLDSFVYGVPTASPVRTGRAYYALQALGSVFYYGELLAFAGDGSMLADFATGAAQVDGNVRLLNSQTGASIGATTIGGSLRLSSTENAISGGIELGQSYESYRGSAHGQFFGPDGEELGISFSGKNSNGSPMVGALLGRRDDSMNIAPLHALVRPTDMHTMYYGQVGLGSLTVDPITKTYAFGAVDRLTLSGASQSAGTPYSQFTVGPDQLAALQSDPNFLTYSTTVDGRSVKASFYKAGLENTEIQLSYSSFVKIEAAPAPGDVPPYSLHSAIRYLVFGQPTPQIYMPKSGAATYVGPIYGTGENILREQLYHIYGNSKFDVNFGSEQLIGELDMKLKPLAGGEDVPVLLTVNLASSTVDGNGWGGASGYIQSQFYGSNAQELGVSFGFMREMNGGAVSLSGVTIAKPK